MLMAALNYRLIVWVSLSLLAVSDFLSLATSSGSGMVFRILRLCENPAVCDREVFCVVCGDADDVIADLYQRRFNAGWDTMIRSDRQSFSDQASCEG